MRWYKHFTDNHRGRTVQRLLDEMGHKGVVCYYFIMEMCAEKLQKNGDLSLSESDCIFTFNKRVIQSATRMKQKCIDNVIRMGEECTVWEAEANENEIIIKMPILLELLDKDLKRARKIRPSAAEIPPSELDKELDKNIYTLAPTKSAKPKPILVKEDFDLERLYAMYPKKLGKQKGMVKFKKLINSQEKYDKLEQAVKNYSKFISETGSWGMHWSTFYSSWEDYLNDSEEVFDDDLRCKIDWDSVITDSFIDDAIANL